MASASIPSFYNTSFPRQPTEFSCVLFFCLVLLTMSVCGSVSLGPCCMHTISYAMCSFHVSIPFPLVFDMCDKYHLSSPYMPCLFEAFLSTLFYTTPQPLSAVSTCSSPVSRIDYKPLLSFATQKPSSFKLLFGG